jgi:Flp pilus assembly protein TadG
MRKEYSPANRLPCMRANRTLPAAVEAAPTENCRGTIGNPEPLMQSNQKNRSGLRKVKQRGSEMIEFTLVLLPFLGFTFLILNIAYAVYQRSTIQHAVAQGVRYAVTSATSTGLGARSSIQKVVQSNAFGSMSSCGSPPTATTNPWCNISVDWYLVDQDTGALVSQDGTKGGNCMTNDGQLPLVEVSVQPHPGKFLVPFVKTPGMGTLSAISIGAVAWDRMEAPAECTTCVPAGYVCPLQ